MVKSAVKLIHDCPTEKPNYSSAINPLDFCMDIMYSYEAVKWFLQHNSLSILPAFNMVTDYLLLLQWERNDTHKNYPLETVAIALLHPISSAYLNTRDIYHWSPEYYSTVIRQNPTTDTDQIRTNEICSGHLEGLERVDQQVVMWHCRPYFAMDRVSWLALWMLCYQLRGDWDGSGAPGGLTHGHPGDPTPSLGHYPFICQQRVHKPTANSNGYAGSVRVYTKLYLPTSPLLCKVGFSAF